MRSFAYRVGSNMAKKTHTYAESGVDVDANAAMVGRIRSAVRRTYGPRVIDAYGGFAGLFRLDYDERLFQRNYREPVLVVCTDGVGTKILVAIASRNLRTVGIDLVAMSVNDLLTVGAEPLLFCDYIAIDKLEPERVAELVEGVADGCTESGAYLAGGETAEMPDLYRKGDFDLAGFAVGVAERRRIINGRRLIRPGDVVVGMASSGLHSNGYSLVRKLVFDVAGLKITDHVDALGCTVGQELLRPTRIYARAVVGLLAKYPVKRVVRGMANITGGGLPENLPRILPDDCAMVLKRDTWPVPAVFDFLQEIGVADDEMFRVFNMGIGYAFVVRPTFAHAVVRHLAKLGERAYIIGHVKRGKGTVEIR